MLRHFRSRYYLALCLWCSGFGFAALTHAQPGDVVLAIQPVLSETQTRAAFQPFADYLSQVSGRRVTIATRPNFMAYWDTLRKGAGYDLVLDAAHFTDYRVQKLGFTVLAKIPDSVSYSLIMRDDDPAFDPAELVGRRIATLGTPSIGAARLNAMYPNPVRQPIAVEVSSAEEGMTLLLAKKVEAAILPTPIVSQRMAQGGGIAVITTTDAIPHIALSAGPSVDKATQERIRRGVLDAAKTPAGQAMLKQIGFERFDPATAAIYTGQANTLKQYWGF